MNPPLAVAAALGAALASATVHTGPTYPVLFLIVALGAVIPVLPTGAAVSAAAAYAIHEGAPSLLWVVLIGAVAALIGDLVLYAIMQQGAPKVFRLLRLDKAIARQDHAMQQLENHRFLVLVVSRLIPAGRIPVMLAAIARRMPMARFAAADCAAAIVWSVAYAVIGILGSRLFPHPWQGVVAAVLLVILITVISEFIANRIRRGRPAQTSRIH